MRSLAGGRVLGVAHSVGEAGNDVVLADKHVLGDEMHDALHAAMCTHRVEDVAAVDQGQLGVTCARGSKVVTLVRVRTIDFDITVDAQHRSSV